MAEVHFIVAGFAEQLRRHGVDVPVSATVAFANALNVVGVGSRESVYWAARATLVIDPKDLAAFDEAFDHYWLGQGAEGTLQGFGTETITLSDDVPDSDAEDGPETEVDAEHVVIWSPAEVLAKKDFSLYEADDLDEAQQLMERIGLRCARRPSRRRRRSKKQTGRFDLEATTRLALKTDGELIRRLTTTNTSVERRLILLVDVSGSMEPYARALLRLAHTAVKSQANVEAFGFGTRLTRLTRELASRDSEAAMAAAADALVDWSGGTRLGPNLAEFNRRWGLRGMARGATVVVMSDGWDRGSAAELDEELARLARVAHRLVWVNPLKASDGFEPTAIGMATAMPYLDDFIEGHNIEALEKLATAVAS